MPTKTNINWTNFSSNPLRYRDNDGKDVWACVKVSSGCSHCYSEALARRWNRGGAFTAENMRGLTPYLDEKEMRGILASKEISEKKVFLCDMTDLFGEWVSDEIIKAIVASLAVRDDVIFQILTKRPERMAAYFNGFDVDPNGSEYKRIIPQNIWLGTSVENQEQADKRIPHLLKCPAAVRFISAEPLLSEIDLWTARFQLPSGGLGSAFNWGKGIAWCIAGGESGPLARPMQAEWAQSLHDQCKAAEVPFWFKQASGVRPGMPIGIPELDNCKKFPACG